MGNGKTIISATVTDGKLDPDFDSLLSEAVLALNRPHIRH
jgi:hypothetical protein